MATKLNFSLLDNELRKGAYEIASLLNIEESSEGTKVSAIKTDKGLKIIKENDIININYREKSEFFRALSHIHDVISDGASVSEDKSFETLGYMLDASRDAVINIESVKKLIRYLAVLGYNNLMLYTEDTFEIPEYPYFGYMRGRYTKEEIKEIDKYAQLFGIELIPCVQTLAHLNAAIRWSCFNDITDCNDILLCGDENTYKLIDSMMKSLSEAFTSRNINIGMDEAHMVGLGKYLDRNGYKNRYDILISHLNRVVEICEKYGFKPMMWSDMFFRLAYSGDYYNSEGTMPENVRNSVPKNLSLVYWDYYSRSYEKYEAMITKHQNFDNNIVFAGGAWKWTGFAPHNHFSFLTSRLALEACKNRGVKDVFVTGWGDNGAECSQFSVIPTLTLYAEYCFTQRADDECLNKRLNDCFGLSLDTFMLLDTPNLMPDTVDAKERVVNPSKYIMYNDPLVGLLDRHINKDTFPAAYMDYSDKLSKYIGDKKFGYIFDTLSSLCRLLSKKCDLSMNIRKAYNEDDKDSLNKISAEDIPAIINLLDDFIAVFRKQWYLENKTFGFDVHELRLGGLKERLLSTALRLKDYTAGNINRIEELEQQVLYFDCRDENLQRPLNISYNNWGKIATALIL